VLVKGIPTSKRKEDHREICNGLAEASCVEWPWLELGIAPPDATEDRSGPGEVVSRNA
jgi:hypothetical protein